MAKTWTNGFLRSVKAARWLLFLSLLVHVNATPKYEFEIDFQHKPVPWHTCPEGWIKYGGKCYKVILNAATWDEAKTICKSFGGSLVKLKGFNKNKGIGKIIREILSKSSSIVLGENELQYSWFGFQQATNGSYHWSDGETSSEQQGFWSDENPELSSTTLKKGSGKCCDLNLKSSKYGEYRWSLRSCEKKKPFVCQTKACNKNSHRCADGKKCYCKYCKCDGRRDCYDGSDEWNCDSGVQCGGELSGSRGTFHTPNYPKKYPKHSDCVWRISVDAGAKIQLEFTDFDIESKYDYVKVYDGIDQDARELGRFAGNKEPEVPLSSGNFLLVRFKSDHSNEKKGFFASWSQVTFTGVRDACGGTLTARPQPTWFTSPLYPEDYPESVVCDWIITAENENQIVTLQFEDFTFETPYDWVEVRDGSDEDEGLFERFTGSSLPKIIMSSGRNLFVRMKSDFAYSLRGFNATYQSGCDVTIRSGYAKIESPGFGVNNYPNNINCSWTLVDPLNRELSLVFQRDFYTERDADKAYVYPTSDESGGHVVHSGRTSPGPSRSDVGEFFVRFTSDDRIRKTGWTAAISFDCPELVVSPPLRLNTTETAYSTAVGCSCDEGYLQEGAAYLTCDLEGEWRPDKLPTCKIIDCGSPSVPSNAVLVTLDKTTYGGVASYRCLEGYDLIGSSLVTCEEGGWSSYPTCQLVTCPKVVPPANGRVDAEENHYGAVITYYCNSGYRLVGSAQAHCMADGTWSSDTPTCQLEQCPAIQGVTNGQPNVTGPVPVGAAVIIQCSHGYAPDADNILRCLNSGDYDKSVPNCLDVNECTNGDLNTCPPHQCVNKEGSYRCRCNPGYHHEGADHTKCEDINECNKDNGDCNHICNNTPGSYNCACNNGYFLFDGNNTVIIDGQEIVPGKTCIATCENFVVTDGIVFIDGTPLPDDRFINPAVAYIQCGAGFVPDGPANVVCRVSGGWSATVTRCQATLCPVLDRPANGDVSMSGREPGSIANYSCSEGFTLSGPDRRFCELQVDSETDVPRHGWSGDKSTCQAVDCGKPEQPENGEVFYTDTGYQSVAIFSCLCGYVLEGSEVRRCQGSGDWSGNNTKCNVRACPKLSPPAFGSIINPVTSFPVGSLVHFRCDRPGYELSDPWPLECLADQYPLISKEKPDYVATVSIEYTASSTIPDSCGPYYGWETIRNLQAFKPHLQLLCEEFGQPAIDVHQTTSGSVEGSKVTIQGSVGFKTQDGEPIATACQCGDEVLAAIIAMDDPSMYNIPASQELNCPAVTAVRGAVSGVDTAWSCPAGLTLENGDQACGEGTPMCRKECLVSLEPSPEPTTTMMPPTTTSTSVETTTRPLTPTVPPTTQAPSTQASTTLKQSTQAPTTQATTTKKTTTNMPTSMQTTTEKQTTESPTTQAPTTQKPTTQGPTTQAPTTQGPTTKGPTTQAPTTQAPTTQASTTQAPTTQGPTTQGPTTQAPTTQAPTTQAPTTQGPTTQGPTTEGPTTQGPTTQAPTTQGPTTQGPTTQAPTTQAPTTQAPTTQAPTTQGPTTQAPTTQAPTTQAPTTQAPTTQAPTTQGPTTEGPTTQAPTTQAPTTQAPTTQGPTTQGPTTQGPTTQGPTTQGPTTQAPTTQGPTTEAPTTVPPPPVGQPIYIVKVEDTLGGAFTPACIDSVHSVINSYVNQLPNMFNAPGSGSCTENSGMKVSLMDGNVVFSDTQAFISVTFRITYQTETKAEVETCAAEYVSFVSEQLPILLGRVQDQVVPNNCTEIEYTSPGCNITRDEWGCEDGMVLDEANWICIQEIVPVEDIPRMILTFQGSFVSDTAVQDYCVEQYHRALIDNLSWMEVELQPKMSAGCTNVYIDISKNLSLSTDNIKVYGTSKVHLYPLSESITYQKMVFCAGFVSSEISKPGDFLTTLTLPANSTYNCSSITLSPEVLIHSADVEYYCPDGHILDESNFRCIKETIATLITETTLRMKVQTADQVCSEQVAQLTSASVQKVVDDVTQRLQNGRLCNTTSTVLLQPQQGKIRPTGNSDQLTITIPFGLLSMSGVKEDVERCVVGLETYLDQTLQPALESIQGDVSDTCGAAMFQGRQLSNHFSQSWSCFGNLVYNPATGICTQILRRSRRDAVSTNLKIQSFHQDNPPHWNTSVPQCLDTQQPVCPDCPTEDITVELGPNGPVPANITLPSFSDNSGAPPSISYIPSDFRLPYLFTTNMTVSVIATDGSGNVQVCPLNIYLIDVTPPIITCPRDIVELYDSEIASVPLNFQSAPVNASDYSGVERIVYLPPEGSLITMLKPITITATAVDYAGNNASCSFVYEAQPEGCPEWSLPTPEGGNKSCSGIVGGVNGTGYSCHVQCPIDKDFVYPPPLQYICELGGTWYPHNIVPDCTDKVSPDYDLDLDFEFEFTGNTSKECSVFIKDKILEALQPIINQPCANAANQLNISASFNMVIQAGKIHVSVKIYISRINPKQAPYELPQACGEAILKKANETKLEVSFEDCGDAIYWPPCEGGGITQCPPGHIPRYNYCLECSRGTFPNMTSGQCQSCPHGSYQDKSGQPSCKPCPTGTSTEQEQSTSEDQCIAQCPPGQSSPTGMIPCSPCEKGWYQPGTGKTECMQCPGEASTQQPGADSIDKCFTACKPGYVSCCGVEPCIPCPKNTYNPDYRGTYCIQCPSNTVTEGIASNHSSQCIVVDQCESHECKHGATCLNNDTFYTCHCPPGYTGTLCETDIDDCVTQPCVNGATCNDGINNFTCSCQPGYEGGNCELETDECESNPCLNGVCVDGHLSYECECYNGFEGTLCETNTDDCASDPCLNEGVCSDMINDYHCDCTGTGFEGKNCENNIDDCCVCSCLNGGTCNDLVNDFNCTCSPGFTGSRCEVDINECNSNPCQNGAVCENNEDEFRCICVPGFTGVQCETDIDECAGNPCQNGATCNDLSNDYSCDCPPGYSGRKCQVDIDDCDPYPCSPDGSTECIDHVDGYDCQCLPLRTGVHCETSLDPCETLTPCADGATCVTVGDMFTCTCPPDYTDSLCGTKIDNCASRPCLNNATCVDGINNYTCVCGSGFQGNNCEVNIDECDSDPCQNGGTCNDIIDGYTCTCPAGFNGTHCETDIDDCASMPCLNEGTCTDLVDDYRCSCVRGYEGKSCEIEIDECASTPCKNGASCIDGIGAFECECPEEFEGLLCENNIDDCALNNTCLNGATCVDGWRSITCVCPPLFGGEDCGKEKSDDYDLQCEGRNGSVCEPPAVFIGANLTEISVCSWVRFAELSGNGTYLTLLEINKQDEENGDEGGRVMLEFSGNQATIHIFNDLDTVEVAMVTNDGLWHQVCFWWSAGDWSLWLDGEVVRSQDNYGLNHVLPEWVQVLAGQKFEASDDDDQFRGEVSQINVYSYILNTTVIEAMAANCSEVRIAGDIYNWVVFGDYIHNDVIIVEPAICGGSECPPGFRGTYCDIKIDKFPPEVEYCPDDISVVNPESRLSVVEWEDPIFTDDIGIVDIQQTHRSGQTFAYGEYLVSYVAYDAENNSAECEFEIIVKPSDCVEPAAPLNGAKACQAWLHGHYCSILCFPDYHFVEFPPPFYRCGKEGFWDPPRGSPFVFPSCSMPHPPASSILGGELDYTGPGCTEEFRTELRNIFIRIMQEMDERMGLCSPNNCSYDGIEVECDGATRRKRETDSGTYKVKFAVNLSAEGAAVEGDGNTYITEEIENSVKRGEFDSDNFKADLNSLLVSVATTCEPGQALTTNDQSKKICLDCPQGYHLNETSGDCEQCEEGTYTDAVRQTVCQPCPPDHTTAAPGATNSSQCYELCEPGSFYSPSANKCELCPLGEYQNEAGQTSCKSCPTGQTTENTGTENIEDCTYLCDLGEELGLDGACHPCPIGTYRDSRDIDSCLACPYGLSTENTGSTSIDDCNVVDCPRGYFRTEANECEICPRGTYQPKRGSTSCIPCGVGQTTPEQGEISQDSCIEGPVNECDLGIDNCHSNAVCDDLEDGFRCTCKKSFLGNGTHCTDKCENYCGDHGTCNKDNEDNVFCTCEDGYSGETCNVAALGGLSDATIGGIAGGAGALLLIIIIGLVCYYRSHRSGKEVMNDRIYRDMGPPVAFQNNAYESLDSGRNQSSLLRLESSSNSSDTQPWKKSVFTAQDEELFDADWEDPIEMEINLDDFEPRQITPTNSLDSYF